MTKSLKVAIIGGGRVAAHHCKMIADVEKVELLAICDLKKQVGEPLAKIYEVPFFENYNQMLKKLDDVDLVTIATPSGMHFEHTADIIKDHKKDIVVEKPTFMTQKQMRDAYNLAEDNNCRIFPVYQNRYNKAVRRVRKAVENGELGDIRMASARVRWCRPQRYYDRDPWRGTYSHDGGALTNQGVHYIDILRHLGGKINRVNAVKATQSVNVEVEDTVAAIFEFELGGSGVIEITTAAWPDDFEASISIVGSKGLAVISGEATNKLITFSPDPTQCEENSEEFEIVYGLGHREMYKDILTVLNNDAEPPVSFEDGMQTLNLLHGIYRSAEDGEWVELSEGLESQFLGEPNEQISNLYRTS